MRFSNVMIVALAATTELTVATPRYQLEVRGQTLSSPAADASYATVKNCAAITTAACVAAGFPDAAKATGSVAILASCAENCVKWQKAYDARQKKKADAAKKANADAEAEKGKATKPIGGVWNPKTGKWEVPKTPTKPKLKKTHTYKK